VLGEDIGWVAFSIYLTQVNAFGPDSLLYPQRMGVEMSELAEPLSRAYANCSAGVSPHAQRQLHADVLEQGLVPEALAGAPDHPCKLCFT